MAVSPEPRDDFQHEQIEQHGADQSGGRPREFSFADINQRVAGNAEVIEDMVGDGVQIMAIRMHRLGPRLHLHRSETDDRKAFFLGVQGDFDGRTVFAGVGDDDDALAGDELVLTVVTLDERGAIADMVFDKPAGRVDDTADASEPTGATDDLASNDLAVAAAEDVEHAVLGDRGADERRASLNGRGIHLSGAGQQSDGFIVKGIGQ